MLLCETALKNEASGILKISGILAPVKNTEIHSHISYLHGCYVADNRQLKLTDFFNSRKVEFPYIIEDDEELINGEYPKLGLPDEYAEEIVKMAELYHKEKELLYCSLFLLGTENSLGSSKKVCAPLLLFPAQIEKGEEFHFISIDKENVRVNSSALGLLTQEDSTISEVDLIREFPDYPFDFGRVGNIGRLLKKNFPELDTESLLLFPELWNGKKIKRQLQPKQRNKIEFFKLVPASGLGMINRSSETYGILSELDQLEEAKEFSKPLRGVFEGVEPVSRPKGAVPSLPTVLNEAQKRAVHNSRSETLSLVVGPPGTGKSYSIACMALEHLMRGESVLITSKQDEAVNVVAEKIRQLLDDDRVYIRGGSKRNRIKMAKRLRELLQKPLPRTGDLKFSLQHDFNKINQKLRKLETRLQKKLDQEIGWSEDLMSSEFSDKLMSFLRKSVHKLYSPHWKVLEELTETLDERMRMSRKMIFANHNDSLFQLLKRNRKTLQNLYNGLQAKQSSQRDSLYEELDFELLLKAFPIWLCRLSELYRILPQQKELFDLVIIDEASQCDMATSLAAVQRAKRVVICGDPNQLRHASFLSKDQMLQVAEGCGLNAKILQNFNFREKSFLDMLSQNLQSQDQITFLDEHYRSVPEIISFSNREFYSNSLRIMTERPIHSTGLGKYFVKTSGARNEKGINEIEAAQILQQVKEIIQDEEGLAPGHKSSIGILSPFRDQTDFIAKNLVKQFSTNAIHDHRIMTGTAYAFQGEERDVMFLSFAVDAKSHHSALVHLNKPDVFNVSITRAKGRQFAYHSIEPEDLPVDHYLRLYLEHQNRSEQEQQSFEEQAHDDFLHEIQHILEQQSMEYWTYYSIAGVPMDLLVKSERGLKGIDLIGYPGVYQDALSVERFKILGRAGIPVFPLAYTFWKFRQEECERELKLFLGVK